MKAGKDHRVPPSPRTITILADMKPLIDLDGQTG